MQKSIIYFNNLDFQKIGLLKKKRKNKNKENKNENKKKKKVQKKEL